MRYRGFEIYALVNIPRCFEIKNTYENGKLDYGEEIPFKPPMKVHGRTPYAYVGVSSSQQTDAHYGIKNVKKQIKKLLEEE